MCKWKREQYESIIDYWAYIHPKIHEHHKCNFLQNWDNVNQTLLKGPFLEMKQKVQIIMWNLLDFKLEITIFEKIGKILDFLMTKTKHICEMLIPFLGSKADYDLNSTNFGTLAINWKKIISCNDQTKSLMEVFISQASYIEQLLLLYSHLLSSLLHKYWWG